MAEGSSIGELLNWACRYCPYLSWVKTMHITFMLKPISNGGLIVATLEQLAFSVPSSVSLCSKLAATH